MEELARISLEFLTVTSRVIFVFTKRHWLALLSIAVLALVVHALFLIYDKAADRELVIYTGLPGSDSHVVGAKLQKALTSRDSAYGTSYRVRLEEANGSDEIQERVRCDTSGKAIGFAQDEHGNAPDAMVVAPLELDYLHVIVGPAMLERMASEIPEQSHRAARIARPRRIPLQLARSVSVNGGQDEDQRRLVDHWKAHCVKMSDVIGHLNLSAGRVYLGPRRSETRRLAKIVLEQCGQRNFDRLSAHGINDWFEVRAGLNTGAIDLAFLVGTLGGDVVKGIADDGSCMLVDLGEIAPALERENPEFKPDKIPKGAYAAASYRPLRYDFCRDEITTLTSRNVIVCSRRMTNFDAYQVAAAAGEALREDFPNGLWRQAGGQNADLVLTTETHPGAEWRRTEKTASVFWSVANWPAWLVAVASTMGVMIVTGFLKWATPQIGQGASSEQAPAEYANVPEKSLQQGRRSPDALPDLRRFEEEKPEALAPLAQATQHAILVQPDATMLREIKPAVDRAIVGPPIQRRSRARRRLKSVTAAAKSTARRIRTLPPRRGT